MRDRIFRRRRLDFVRRIVQLMQWHLRFIMLRRFLRPLRRLRRLAIGRSSLVGFCDCKQIAFFMQEVDESGKIALFSSTLAESIAVKRPYSLYFRAGNAIVPWRAENHALCALRWLRVASKGLSRWRCCPLAATCGLSLGHQFLVSFRAEARRRCGEPEPSAKDGVAVPSVGLAVGLACCVHGCPF